jgi:hypothetical protein
VVAVVPIRSDTELLGVSTKPPGVQAPGAKASIYDAVGAIAAGAGAEWILAAGFTPRITRTIIAQYFLRENKCEGI